LIHAKFDPNIDGLTRYIIESVVKYQYYNYKPTKFIPAGLERTR